MPIPRSLSLPECSPAAARGTEGLGQGAESPSGQLFVPGDVSASLAGALTQRREICPLRGSVWPQRPAGGAVCSVQRGH